MPDDPYELAAVLAARDPGELYSGLSILVSTAVDGGRCAALASFGALELLIGRDGALSSRAGPGLARSLVELRQMALSMENLTIWACAASVDALNIEDEPLAGVMSTPRFLRETAGARRFIHV